MDKQTNNQTSNNLIIEIKELKVKEKQNIITNTYLPNKGMDKQTK